SPMWAIENVLPRMGGLLISGLPHAMRSLVTMCALLESVSTKRVWGKFAVPGPIKNAVFIETEDSLNLVRRRLLGLCKGLGLKNPPPGFHLVRPGPFNLIDEGEQKLRQIIEATHADVLALSTLQGLISGRDWKEQRDMGPINSIFVRLQQLCSLIVLTHSPWKAKR